MMISEFKDSLALVVACAIVVPMMQVERGGAIDRFWQGDVSNVYGGSAAAAGNWNFWAVPGHSRSPRALKLSGP